MGEGGFEGGVLFDCIEEGVALEAGHPRGHRLDIVDRGIQRRLQLLPGHWGGDRGARDRADGKRRGDGLAVAELQVVDIHSPFARVWIAVDRCDFRYSIDYYLRY